MNGMLAAQTFFGAKRTDLEKLMNQWFATLPWEIVVESVQFAVDGYGEGTTPDFYALIVYRTVEDGR